MATPTAVVARNLLKHSKSLPQILRGQILGRSNPSANPKNIVKDHHHHQIVQSLFVSNQKIYAQTPIFGFPEMGSLVGSNGGLSLAEKSSLCRGKGLPDDDDELLEDDEFNEDFEDEFDDDDDDDEFDDDDDDEFDDGTLDVKDKTKF